MLTVTVTSKTDPDEKIRLEIPLKRDTDLKRVTNWRNRLDREALSFEIHQQLQKHNSVFAFRRWDAQVVNKTPAYRNKIRGAQVIHTTSHWL